MTDEERKMLHQTLFKRAMREIINGSVKDAQTAVELMERIEPGEDTASMVLAALLGDDRIPDGTGDGACLCGADAGE